MKVLAIALLACSLASTSFAGETVEVTGPRIKEGTPGAGMGGGRPGGSQEFERPKFQGGEGGLGGGTFKLPGELSNAQILVLVLEQWRETVQTLSQMEAWGELDVTVTLKDGTKVEVHLKVGFGKSEVVSTKKK